MVIVIVGDFEPCNQGSEKFPGPLDRLGKNSPGEIAWSFDRSAGGISKDHKRGPASFRLTIRKMEVATPRSRSKTDAGW